MLIRLHVLVLTAFLATMVILTCGAGSQAFARSSTLSPTDKELMFRRYRGEDEVTDHDRGQGRGRSGESGRGAPGHDGDSSRDENSGGSSSSGGNSGHGKGSGSDRDDSDDRFGS